MPDFGDRRQPDCMLGDEVSGMRKTLPGRDYHDPAVFELERERVFSRQWFYAARADEASEPGDFVTVDVAGESIVVVRGQDELRTGHRTVTDVAANWKIIVENYNECLHCPTVHPELVAVAPTFRRGEVFEAGRDDFGISIAGGGVGYTASGTTAIPVMPGLDEKTASSMYGASVFPNMFLDLTGTVAIATRLQPRDAGHTTIVTDYLFRPEVVADPAFDPREVVEFSELV